MSGNSTSDIVKNLQKIIDAIENEQLDECDL